MIYLQLLETPAVSLVRCRDRWISDSLGKPLCICVPLGLKFFTMIMQDEAIFNQVDAFFSFEISQTLSQVFYQQVN